MTFTRPTAFSKGIPSSARLQAAIYLGLTCIALGLLLPWSGQTPSSVASQLIQAAVIAVIVVLAIRHYQLQARVRRLEHRLHQLAPSQAKTYDYQPLPHMDVDQFFSKEQTRH